MTRNRLFDVYALIAAQIVSTLGTQVTTIATYGALLDKSGDTLYAALPFLINAAVFLVAGFFSMTFLDRFSSKKVVIVSDVVRALLLLAIVFSEHVTKEMLLGLQTLSSIFGVFFDSSRESLFTEKLKTLSSSEQNHYLSLDQMLWRGVEVVGYGVAFVLVSTVSFKTAYFADALTFLAAALLIAFVKPGTRALAGSDTEKYSATATIRGGVQAVLGNSILARISAIRALFWFGGGIFNLLLITAAQLMVREFEPQQTVALWEITVTVSMILGLQTTKMYFAQHRPKGLNRQLFLACAAGCLVMAGAQSFLVLLPATLLFFALTFLNGFGMGLNSYGMRRLRQLSLEDHTRGRAIAFTNILANSAQVAGMALVLVSGWGFATHVLLSAFCFLAAALLAGSSALGRTETVPATSVA